MHAEAHTRLPPAMETINLDFYQFLMANLFRNITIPLHEMEFSAGEFQLQKPTCLVFHVYARLSQPPRAFTFKFYSITKFVRSHF